MGQVGYLILAIVLFVLLVVIFFISFVAYRKTPVPKGCEKIHADEEACGSCGVSACPYKEELTSHKEEKKS